MTVKMDMNKTKNTLIDFFAKKGDFDTLLSLKNSHGLDIKDIIYSLVSYKKLDELNYIYNQDKSTIDDILSCLALFGYSDKIKHFYTISNSGKNQLNIIASCAALRSYYDISIWAITKGADDIQTIMCNFAYAGTLYVAKDLLGVDISKLNINKLAKSAANGGNEDLVNNLIEDGANDYLYIASGAAENGYSDIVLKLYQKYKNTTGNFYFVNLFSIAKSAAKGGYIDILEWSLDSFIKREQLTIIMNKAIKYKQIKVIKWLLDNEYFDDADYIALNCEGDYKIIKLAIEYGARNLTELTKYAVIEQRKDILKLVNSTTPIKQNTFSLASFVFLSIQYYRSSNTENDLLRSLFTYFCTIKCIDHLKSYYSKKPSHKIFLEIIYTMIYSFYIYLIYVLTCLITHTNIVYFPKIKETLFTANAFYIIIFSPLVEEIIFRRLVQIELDRYFITKLKNRKIAILISSLIGSLYFAITHSNFALNVLPASLLLIILFRLTKEGLISAIIFHSLYNFVVYSVTSS